MRPRIIAGLIASVAVLLLAFTGDGDPTDNARRPCCEATTQQN